MLSSVDAVIDSTDGMIMKLLNLSPNFFFLGMQTTTPSMKHSKSWAVGSWMTNLPELGTNLIPTLSTLDMKNLSHGAAEREGKKEFSPNKGAQAMGGRKVGGIQGTRGETRKRKRKRRG